MLRPETTLTISWAVFAQIEPPTKQSRFSVCTTRRTTRAADGIFAIAKIAMAKIAMAKIAMAKIAMAVPVIVVLAFNRTDNRTRGCA